MTPQQYYDSPAIETTTDIYALERHVDMINTISMNTDANEKVELKYYVNECFDGERGLAIFSVWYDGKPFMMCFEGGRGNRDSKDKIVTNLEVYNEFIIYLTKLSLENDEYPIATHDLNEHVHLTFYGCDLNGYYDQTFTPKFNVGDIVLATVPVNHLRYGSGTIETRCRIEKVHPYNRAHSYHMLQLDRRWPTEKEIIRLKIGHHCDTMIEDKDNGSVGASGNDETVREFVSAE